MGATQQRPFEFSFNSALQALKPPPRPRPFGSAHPHAIKPIDPPGGPQAGLSMRKRGQSPRSSSAGTQRGLSFNNATCVLCGPRATNASPTPMEAELMRCGPPRETLWPRHRGSNFAFDNRLVRGERASEIKRGNPNLWLTVVKKAVCILIRTY